MHCSRWLIGAIGVAMISGSAWAQDTAGAGPPTEQEPPVTFKAEVSEVPVYFVVHDKHGGLVADLKKEDFEVFEEGKPQTIRTFRADTDRPLTLGLMIDTSGSQTRVLEAEKEFGEQFIREVLTPKDLAFMINFDVDVSLDQDLTGNKQKLVGTLGKMKINAGGVSGGIPGLGQGPIAVTPRGTLLFDAVYLAANDKMKNEAGRKALIFLTDGGDQGSQMKLRDAIEAAQKADTICYVILVSDSGQGEPGDMRKLAEETGGRMIEAGNDAGKMKRAFDQIGEELRTQYELTYTLQNKERDGRFRRIEIKEKDGLKVQARKGYYAAAE